ncbi:transposase [Streptomyces pseudovenezuelae]|uniref:Transposase n=1 Tax=Streptomyces pseudovenezuelae TaxID=67350 RepID=A0ABT6M1Y6_9ACTN|nr:transposase [Streptomyces pseudovenezuelae]
MMLEYKCARYGRELVLIDRFFPSGKLRGNSGTVREWMCDNCGVVHDRDANAPRNSRKPSGRSLESSRLQAGGEEVNGAFLRSG